MTKMSDARGNWLGHRQPEPNQKETATFHNASQMRMAGPGCMTGPGASRGQQDGRVGRQPAARPDSRGYTLEKREA